MTESGKRLYRARSDRMVAGVAGGMAHYFGMDPIQSRVMWVLVLVFTFPVGLIAYFVLALVIPEEPGVAPPPNAPTPQSPPGPPGPPPGSP